MKEIMLFKLAHCPHCKLALKFQAELLAEHPDWANIPLRIVDEAEEVDFANAHDYYLVPTYFVDGVKIHEGHAEREDVERVFRAAAEETARV